MAEETMQQVNETARTEGGAAGDQPVEKAELERLRTELAEARAKAEEHWNAYLRALAELENVRKRAEREVEQAQKFALERFATELLAVKDSLEMGLAALGETTGDDAVGKLREGKALTLRILKQAFERFGISEIDPAGQPFDPERHEAMMTQPSAEAAPGTVLSVVQKGYLLNGRLLRPARVVVARPAGSAADAPAEGTVERGGQSPT